MNEENNSNLAGGNTTPNTEGGQPISDVNISPDVANTVSQEITSSSASGSPSTVGQSETPSTDSQLPQSSPAEQTPTSSTASSFGAQPLSSPEPFSASSGVGVTPGPTSQPTKGKKHTLKLVLMILAVLILVGAGTTTGYMMGKSKTPPAPTVAEKPPINLPPEAIVTSECTPGRGKQYIIPKDIPKGPIYDVVNSKVIAIEYIIGIQELLSNAGTFSDTILLLTKNYPVDHFSIVPKQPAAGDTDQSIHLIMFVVPKEEAAAITCADQTNTTTTPPATPTTPPATTE